MMDSGEEHVGESSSLQNKSKKQCHRHTVKQIQQLEAFFKQCPHPDENQRNQLGRDSGLDPKQIKFWFQNKRTQTKHEKISNIIANVLGRSFLVNPRLAPPNSTLVPSNSSDECSTFEYLSPPTHQANNNDNNVRGHSININNIPIMSPPPEENFELHHDDREKAFIFKVILAAIDEVIELLQVNDPIWEKSSSDERCFIHRESYDKFFSNPNRPYKSSTARFESSRHSGVVPMTAIELMQNFLDPVKWMNMFPTIVSQARTIEVLDSWNLGGSIQLMYEKLHILSPLVVARDFFFIRCCRQLDPRMWIMVDVSYDLFKEIQSGVPSYSWKFPSGCVIQDMGNGQSMVSWIEHVQVDDKNHRIFRELLSGRQTYGAKRWIVTLQRMCERYNFAIAATCPTRRQLSGVIRDPQGLKNLMQLAQRMVKSFFETLSTTDKLDFPFSSQLNSGDRICLRKNEEITQPRGFIATAATSLLLPLPFQTVFNFFKDDKTRSQWDVLTNANNVIELARVLTGTFPGNSITIIQPYGPKENIMLVLQESSIDEMGAFVVFAPIELSTATSIISGGDATNVAILPSGISMSPDGRLASDRESTGNTQNGSILTVAFQILICGDDNSMSKQQHMEAVATVHSLLSSTILKIKAALGCSD
ncbi:unnamed protein product [Withania somnifera]